ncbi:MAG: flagellar assembly protein FliW [Cyanobacteria bacterium]|nr:flagellar assembly protein FliW [Cyanobacteriota bacterium]
MNTNTIQTHRFGEITVDESKIIRFVSPILGFDGQLQYVLLDHSEDSPFKWLQSLEDPSLAFVVTNPLLFGLEYRFSLAEEVQRQIGLKTAEDALILTIVNIPQDDPGRMTTNLLGPIIVNQPEMKAIQIVLNESEYSTKARLISDDVLNQKQTEDPAG